MAEACAVSSSTAREQSGIVSRHHTDTENMKTEQRTAHTGDLTWSWAGQQYPAISIDIVDVDIVIGTGMSTHTQRDTRMIPTLSREVAQQVLADHKPTRVYDVGTARGCAQDGLVYGVFGGRRYEILGPIVGGRPAIQEHAGHGHYRTVAFIGAAPADYEGNTRATAAL